LVLAQIKLLIQQLQQLKLADNAVTAGKLATTLDLSGSTITLPSTFVTTTGTQTLTNKTINASQLV
jgi:dihydroxyacetone kinase